MPGRLTAMLRGKYGLNRLLSGSEEKNRNDHRHHAVDAAVIGICDRPLLRRFAEASNRARSQGLARLVDATPDPFPGYREQVQHAIAHIWVSHKPDHGYEGPIMEDTAWSILENGQVSMRRLDKDGRRVRLIETKKVIPITDVKASHRHGLTADGLPKAYKGYVGGNNFCLEIKSLADGTWKGVVISTFEAYKFMRDYPGAKREEGLRRLRVLLSLRDGAPLVMRLHKGDMVRMAVDGGARLWRVVVIRANGQVSFAPHNEANVDARERDKQDPFCYVSKTAGTLQKIQARYVTVSPIGETRVQRMLRP